ncbi:glutamine amidotransferase-related protein [Parendozoicomonas haliclonae]|uniref:Glutamine amidotransferase class-I n=1 Tax=Parendozoicomonas haliclonae TaxID=1960125 RepID=A0A1X7AH07_9GAMM|nr:gamma-glutamyl-gamma-aminobutyrate hydrolase family protein [Parendozoicomonas haliclonae]SMA34583.1 Glutamine amidotransferase class-I [Parendozoicomonas haliclonae]
MAHEWKGFKALVLYVLLATVLPVQSWADGEYIEQYNLFTQQFRTTRYTLLKNYTQVLNSSENKERSDNEQLALDDGNDLIKGLFDLLKSLRSPADLFEETEGLEEMAIFSEVQRQGLEWEGVLREPPIIDLDPNDDDNDEYVYTRGRLPCTYPESFKSPQYLNEYMQSNNCSMASYLLHLKENGDSKGQRLVFEAELEEIDFQLGADLDVSYERMRLALSSGRKDTILDALKRIDDGEKTDSGELLKNYMLVGMPNYDGQFSQKFQNLGKMLGFTGKFLLVSLNHDVFMEERIRSRFDGFIFPGADDTFFYNKQGPFKPFQWQDMNVQKVADEELMYQLLFGYIMEKGIPALGTCAGIQHLALKQGGRVSLMANSIEGNKKVTLVPGTLNHFFGLTSTQQSDALNACRLSPVTFSTTLMHSYIVDEPGLDVTVGSYLAGSDRPLIMGASYGGHIATYQFHPEYVDSHNLKDPNHLIVTNHFEQFRIYRAMKEAGTESGYAPGMNVMLSRLQNCLENRDIALNQPEYWFNGSRSEELVLPEQLDTLTVYLVPGMTPDTIKEIRFGKRIIVQDQKTGASLTVVPANDRQHIEVKPAG